MHYMYIYTHTKTFEATLLFSFSLRSPQERPGSNFTARSHGAAVHLHLQGWDRGNIAGGTKRDGFAAKGAAFGGTNVTSTYRMIFGCHEMSRTCVTDILLQL